MRILETTASAHPDNIQEIFNVQGKKVKMDKFPSDVISSPAELLHIVLNCIQGFFFFFLKCP